MFSTLFAVLAVLGFVIALASGWFACGVERKLTHLERQCECARLAHAHDYDAEHEARQARHQAIGHRLQVLTLPLPPEGSIEGILGAYTLEGDLVAVKRTALRELVELLAGDVEPIAVATAPDDDVIDF